MTALLQVCAWIHDLPWATAIRESEITFPALETVHVLSLGLMVGTIAIVDLRLLGVVLRHEPVARIAAPLLPATWIGFGLMLSTGGLLFAAEATDMYANPAFRLKLLLLGLAGLNMLVFHFTSYSRRVRWGSEVSPPVGARIAAAASLTLWTGVIIMGRAIAYFHHHG